ncbi:two-component sensor histidine kinase [Limibaculum sp. M0105]|uniref:histidine kinase n=1 Tax=Thermohalobaculum xanthum TaxID=2753746 RepID=A0A8J7M6E6_9RHOB|nr:ATP-binding protein [Thermohalobaculum xanthum]MBK0399416.1 two-component sensor histidine kinase [Thermohalobaculum xanthum]
MKRISATLKKFTPRSLFRRALMILVLPILLLQVVVAVLFIQRHYDGVTGQMATAVAREIRFVISQIENLPDVDAANEMLATIAIPLGFDFSLRPDDRVEPDAVRALYDVTGGVIEETLKDELRRPMALDLVTYPKHVDARISTTKGVLQVLIPRRRMNASNPHLLLVWMTTISVVLTTVAVIFLRNQVRPIRELATVASAFGRGRSLPFRPSGAEEVRRAGIAFVDMRNRIERQMQQRTRMLSGVSHDLRTPLTRMKLALAVIDPSPETAELSRDVSEMEHMLDAFLAFARGEAGELSSDTDPVELAEEIAEDARRRGRELALVAEVETPGERAVSLRRQAVKRCVVNLVENALAYGDTVSLGVRLGPKSVEFTVEDDGPGIPPDKREEVLRPFTRLDEARGQNIASGVGLGLSIALDIARSHGGSLSLDESRRLGGLRACVRLPR